MNDCDDILQRFSQYLDSRRPESELMLLRQEAASRPGCQAMLDAMLWMHQSLTSAAMVDPTRDFAASVTQELARRQRRDKLVLGGVLMVGFLIMLAPVLLILWAGLAVTLQPGLLQTAISWALAGISDIATYGAALTTLLRHAPQWATISVSAFLSLSFLLLALAVVMQKSPELIFGPATVKHQTA